MISNINIEKFQQDHINDIIKMKLECDSNHFVYLHSDGNLYYGDIFEDCPYLMTSFGCKSETEREAKRDIESIQSMRNQRD